MRVGAGAFVGALVVGGAVSGCSGEGSAPAVPPPPAAPPAAPAGQGADGQGAGQATNGQGAGVDRAALQNQLDQLLAAAPITFSPDSATLTPSGQATVDRVGALLAPAAGVGVKVTGYTAPGPGDPATAQNLSQQRAQAVADALAAKGVTPDRVQAVGAGNARDVAAGAARRVDLTLT